MSDTDKQIQSFEYQDPSEYNEWGNPNPNTRQNATRPPIRSSYPSIYEQNHHQSPHTDYTTLPQSNSTSNQLNQSQTHSTSTSSSNSHSYSTSHSNSNSMGWPSATPQGYHYEEPKGSV